MRFSPPRLRLLVVVALTVPVVSSTAMASSGSPPAGGYWTVCQSPRCVSTYLPLTPTTRAQSARVAPRAVMRALSAVQAALASFTWSGGTPSSTGGADDWSNGTNWAGGVTPSGSVGKLTFPVLTATACTSSPPTDTCYQTFNNIVGLAAHTISIDDASTYFLQGDAIKLGAGGLRASTTKTTFSGGPQVSMPITLTAPQTWTFDGHNIFAQVNLSGKVTGATRALTVDLNHDTAFGVDSANVEAGPITINTTQTTGGNSSIVGLVTGGKLNAIDGNSVSLMAAGVDIVVAGNAAVGALNADAGNIQVANGSANPAKLSVNGGFTQGSSNELVLNVSHPGTTAGTDYSQLAATGAISLGGALALSGSTSGNPPTCPTLHPGDVDTLLTTTGSLTGTFVNVPNGATVSVGCGPGTEPTGRITYTANSVTFTVLTAGG